LSKIEETISMPAADTPSVCKSFHSALTRSRPNSSQMARISWKRGRVNAAMIITESLALEFDQTNPRCLAQKASRREESISHFNLNGGRIQVAARAYFFASSAKNAV
jgi:hypothetical protein